MKKILFIIIAIAIAALFLVPESMIGEYKGLLKIKYGLKDAAITAKNIVTSFARTGEKPKELDALEKSATEKLKEGAKDALKEGAKETIDGL
ncbi:MAG: hypothetical protein WAP23_00845 [Candidatus Spechtbacterales bacterium]